MTEVPGIPDDRTSDARAFCDSLGHKVRQRIHKPISWNPPIQQKSSQLAPRPFAAQAQRHSQTPPTAGDRPKRLATSRFGHNFAEIAISSPVTRPPAPIQPKSTASESRHEASFAHPFEERFARQEQTRREEASRRSAKAFEPNPLFDKIFPAGQAQRGKGAAPTSNPDVETNRSGSPIQAQLTRRGPGAKNAQGNRNKTGLPDKLKTGIEALSGLSMDDVRVHYNSGKPAHLEASAYTQGTDIHVGPGQDRRTKRGMWCNRNKAG